MRVRSQVMQWVESGLQSPPDSTNSTGEDSQPKRRRVRFQSDDAIPVNQVFLPTQQSQEDSSRSSAIPNLSNRDLCSFLQKPCLEHELDKCVGYLDTCCDETFRHSIYNFVPDSHHLQKVVSIYQVLDNTAEKNVSIVDQLKLARSLVAAVLKFHSTPWLAQCLTLRDISLFQSSKDLSKCLPTLHLDTSFVASRTDGAMSGRREVGTDGSEEAASTMARAYEDAKLDHGIRNMTVSTPHLNTCPVKIMTHVSLPHSSGPSASSSCRSGTGHDYPSQITCVQSAGSRTRSRTLARGINS